MSLFYGRKSIFCREKVSSMDSHHHSHYDERESEWMGSSHHSSHHHVHSSIGSGYYPSSSGNYSGSTHHHHHHHSPSGEYQESVHHHHHSSSNDYEETEYHHHSHHHGMHPHDRALQASALSIAAGLFSVVVVVISHIISHLLETLPNLWINAVSAALSIVGLLLCFYAQIVQIRYWSSTVRKRMRIGLTICLLSLVVVGTDTYQYVQRPNFSQIENQIGGAQTGTDKGEAHVNRSGKSVDTSIFKPGWYGETEKNGVTFVLSSFQENAIESRRFHQRIDTHVSFATLSVMNLGMKPAIIDSLTPELYCKDNQSYSALPVKELLMKKETGNEDLLALLETPKELKSGQMLSAVPICMPADFQWNEVKSVEFTLNGEPLKIEGRMFTAEEKRKMVEVPTDTQSKTSETPSPAGSPMNYYDNL